MVVDMHTWQCMHVYFNIGECRTTTLRWRGSSIPVAIGLGVGRLDQILVTFPPGSMRGTVIEPLWTSRLTDGRR